MSGVDEQSGDPGIVALQAELDASLSVGVVPNGWEHQIAWSGDEAGVHPVATAVLVVGTAVTCGVAWGWKAGLAGLFAAVGVRMLFAVRGGPRLGQMVTETFTPPHEKLLDLGIAGHELLGVTRSRPEFSVTRPATAADVRSTRQELAVLGAGFVVGATLTVLEESHAISPATYLRATSLLSAVVLAAVAVWIWRWYGRIIPLLEPRPAADGVETVDEVLDTATTGGTTDALISALFARLPPKVIRVLVPALVLGWGGLTVLVAFSVAPDRTELWSGLAATTELVVFVLAGVRGLLLAIVSVVRRDWATFGAALWMAVLTGVLLLAAKLFGWLDDWSAVISWVRDHLG